MAFYAKGPVCRYCHVARGRNLSITSLRHSRPGRLVAETWGTAGVQLMDSFSRGRARGVIMHAYYARVASVLEMRLGNTASICEKNLR